MTVESATITRSPGYVITLTWRLQDSWELAKLALCRSLYCWLCNTIKSYVFFLLPLTCTRLSSALSECPSVIFDQFIWLIIIHLKMSLHPVTVPVPFDGPTLLLCFFGELGDVKTVIKETFAILAVEPIIRALSTIYISSPAFAFIWLTRRLQEHFGLFNRRPTDGMSVRVEILKEPKIAFFATHELCLITSKALYCFSVLPQMQRTLLFVVRWEDAGRSKKKKESLSWRKLGSILENRC